MDTDLLDAIQYDESQPDVESIMSQIRAHLAEQRGMQARIALPQTRSGVFDADVYEELYQADRSLDMLHVTPHLTPTRLPVIGGLWQRVRLALHRLILYYVDRLAEAEVRLNAHLLRAVNGVVQGIDGENRPNQMTKLEQRLQEVEARLAALENREAAAAAGKQEET